MAFGLYIYLPMMLLSVLNIFPIIVYKCIKPIPKFVRWKRIERKKRTKKRKEGMNIEIKKKKYELNYLKI